MKLRRLADLPYSQAVERIMANQALTGAGSHEQRSVMAAAWSTSTAPATTFADAHAYAHANTHAYAHAHRHGASGTWRSIG
jgi:hypothetical protein